MLGDDDERRRRDDRDGGQLELRRVERRHREGPGGDDRVQVNEAEPVSKGITAHNRDQDRNDFEEAAEKHVPDDRNQQRDGRDQHGIRVYTPIGAGSRRLDVPGHFRGDGHKLKPDDGDDRAHGRRRENHIEPTGAYGANKKRDEDKK